MKRAVLYLRVSTIDQTTANQERELRQIASRMGCEITKVYKDHGISGAKDRDKRPAFGALCRDAAKRQFDMVMAWSVDRLGRSLQDLVAFLSDLHALRIDLFLHQQGIDTTTFVGQGDVSDDGRVRRVRACDDPGTGACGSAAGQERGHDARPSEDRRQARGRHPGHAGEGHWHAEGG